MSEPNPFAVCKRGDGKKKKRDAKLSILKKISKLPESKLIALYSKIRTPKQKEADGYRKGEDPSMAVMIATIFKQLMNQKKMKETKEPKSKQPRRKREKPAPMKQGRYTKPPIDPEPVSVIPKPIVRSSLERTPQISQVVSTQENIKALTEQVKILEERKREAERRNNPNISYHITPNNGGVPLIEPPRPVVVKPERKRAEIEPYKPVRPAEDVFIQGVHGIVPVRFATPDDIAHYHKIQEEEYNRVMALERSIEEKSGLLSRIEIEKEQALALNLFKKFVKKSESEKGGTIFNNLKTFKIGGEYFSGEWGKYPNKNQEKFKKDKAVIEDITGETFKDKPTKLKLVKDLMENKDNYFHSRYRQLQEDEPLRIMKDIMSASESDLLLKYYPEVSTYFLTKAGSGSVAGAGSVPNNGEAITNLQINEAMKDISTFHGCFMRDDEYPIIEDDKEHSYIINTDFSDGDGLHWLSVFCSKKEKGHSLPTIEFYDPLGDSCPDDIFHSIMRSVKNGKIRRFKENLVKNQNDVSENCGRFAMKFIRDRHKGVSFVKATGFKRQNDSNIKEKQFGRQPKLLNEVKQFQTKLGKGFFDITQKSMPRNIKVLLENYGSWVFVPEKSTINRKPITATIRKLGDIISWGALEKKLEELNYDEIYHLFGYFTFRNPEGNEEKTWLMEKNERVIAHETIGEREISESLPLQPNGEPQTMAKMFEVAENNLGVNLWRYKGDAYNCQNFMGNLLIQYLTPEQKEWLLQDARELFKAFPRGTSTVAQYITDIGETITRWFGVRGGKIVNGGSINDIPWIEDETLFEINRKYHDKPSWQPKPDRDGIQLLNLRPWGEDAWIYTTYKKSNTWIDKMFDTVSGNFANIMSLLSIIPGAQVVTIPLIAMAHLAQKSINGEEITAQEAMDVGVKFYDAHNELVKPVVPERPYAYDPNKDQTGKFNPLPQPAPLPRPLPTGPPPPLPPRPQRGSVAGNGFTTWQKLVSGGKYTGSLEEFESVLD